jgi:hypothetical protein
VTPVASEGTPLRPHRLRRRSRLFTAYLPLVWGFATLTWMRRREYV